jgi:HlyD family secretion protein
LLDGGLHTQRIILREMQLETSAFRAPRPLRRLLLLVVFLIALGLPALLVWEARAPVGAAAALASDSAGSTHPENGAVACLGHIEPQDGVLQVTAAYLDGRPQRVSELRVKQGDPVRAGELLAVLDGKEQLQTAVRLDNARVDLARARLAQVKAGASASDIAAQKAEVSQAQAALDNARTEYHRYEVLHQNTDVSAADLDARRLVVHTDEQRLEEAEERLKSISAVRPTELDVAESELRVALAETDHARASLKSAMVYAPTAGRVLKIHAYPGEETGPEGLLDLGKTDSMYVEADVYETDISRVHPGQHAAVTSDLFSGKLSGKVETVGTTLSKSEILPLDPVAFADARVFKVRIRLDDGTQVAGLIHGKVNVVIQP